MSKAIVRLEGSINRSVRIDQTEYESIDGGSWTEVETDNVVSDKELLSKLEELSSMMNPIEDYLIIYEVDKWVKIKKFQKV